MSLAETATIMVVIVVVAMGVVWILGGIVGRNKK